MNIVLTGPVHSGKTTLLKKLVRSLEPSKMKIHGFLSVAVFEDTKFTGYDLFSLPEKNSIPFIRKSGQKDWMRIGPYYFLPQALAEARRIIDNPDPKDVLIVDEIGPLELAGKGFWPVFIKVAPFARFHILCVVRKTILSGFLKAMPKIKWNVFDAAEENVLSRLKDRLETPP